MKGNYVIVPIQKIDKGILTACDLYLSLNNLILFPNLAKNLVSIRQLGLDNLVSIEFYPNSFSVKDLTKNTTLLVRRVEN